MNTLTVGNASSVPTEEPVMGIFSRFGLRRPEGTPRWLDRWLLPAGRHSQKLDEIKRAAAADVAAMEEEDREYFRQDGPGKIEDDL
jgi:hypothetical protein